MNIRVCVLIINITLTSPLQLTLSPDLCEESDLLSWGHHTHTHTHNINVKCVRSTHSHALHDALNTHLQQGQKGEQSQFT